MCVILLKLPFTFEWGDSFLDWWFVENSIGEGPARLGGVFLKYLYVKGVLSPCFPWVWLGYVILHATLVWGSLCRQSLSQLQSPLFETTNCWFCPLRMKHLPFRNRLVALSDVCNNRLSLSSLSHTLIWPLQHLVVYSYWDLGSQMSLILSKTYNFCFLFSWLLLCDSLEEKWWNCLYSAILKLSTIF